MRFKRRLKIQKKMPKRFRERKNPSNALKSERSVGGKRGTEDGKLVRKLQHEVQKVFPRGRIFFLQKSKETSMYRRQTPRLILVEDRSPILLTPYTKVKGLRSLCIMKTQIRVLSRRVTSLLQSRVSEPILIYPVFWNTQSKKSLGEKVEKADAWSERHFPQGRLVMTPVKHAQLVKAAEELLQQDGRHCS